MQTSPLLDELILRAQKPSRYVGGEFGAIHKDLSAARCRFALAFPDTYEVGMSNLGFRLLYHALNGLRIIIMDFWPSMTRYHKQLWYLSWVLFVLIGLPILIQIMAPAFGLEPPFRFGS